MCQKSSEINISTAENRPNVDGYFFVVLPACLKGASVKENISRREQQFPVKVKRGSVEIKIYRTTSRGYDQFTVSYYQDSQRKRIAFSTLEEAKSHAEIQATRLSSSDAAVLKLSGADLSAYQRARQLLDPLGIAVEVAAAEFSDAKKKLPGISLSHAVEFYLKRHPHKLSRAPYKAWLMKSSRSKKLTN